MKRLLALLLLALVASCGDVATAPGGYALYSCGVLTQPTSGGPVAMRDTVCRQ